MLRCFRGCRSQTILADLQVDPEYDSEQSGGGKTFQNLEIAPQTVFGEASDALRFSPFSNAGYMLVAFKNGEVKIFDNAGAWEGIGSVTLAATRKKIPNLSLR